MKTGYPQEAYAGYTKDISNGYYTVPDDYNSNNSYNSGRYSIVKPLVMAITILLVMSGMFFVLAVFIIHPQEPIFKVDTFSVSNFNINNDSLLNADWDISFKICNPNTKFDLFCHEIDALIFYKRNVLSITSLQPFLLGNNDKGFLHDKLETREDLVESDMEEDRKSGIVDFSVRMRFMAIFQMGGGRVWWWNKRLIIFCENLRLYFVGNTGNGKLGPGSSICLLNEH